MIKIVKYKNVLLLKYTPENDLEWIRNTFEKNEEITLRKTYTLNRDDIYISDEVLPENLYFDEDDFVFNFAVLENDYYRIKSEILAIDFKLFIHKDISITDKFFTAYRNISIFAKIRKFISEDVYIGFDEGTLPIETFLNLLKIFPGTVELTKYSNARISGILREFYNVPTDDVTEYNKYIRKKEDKLTRAPKYGKFALQEHEKYTLLLNELESMLKGEDEYLEKDWQQKILDIFLLLYPRYIQIFEEVHIRDVYQNKDRRLDFLLVDSNGNIDIVEVKKPFNLCIVSASKYRDNYIPLHELSGTVMQIEKYIYYLNKWGRDAETKLTERYKTQLPPDFQINITNPKGIIIMGREDTLSIEQLKDFEIIKRKYNNVIDIITYDELLRRLRNIVKIFEIKQKNDNMTNYRSY